MPDPNDILKQLQMVAEEVQRSKTGLGYSADLMAKLGMVVFGNMSALRDAIQAPDGQSWRSGMSAEAERRAAAEDDALRLHGDKMRYYTALLEMKCRDDRNGSLHQNYRDIIDRAMADEQLSTSEGK